MNRLAASALAALLLLSLPACGQAPTEPAPEPPPTAQPSQPEVVPIPEPASEPAPEEPAAAEIEKRLCSMSLEEKIGQLFFVHCPAENAGTDVKTYHLGGYLLFGRDFKDQTASEIIQAIASYQAAADDGSGIPLLIGVDEEGGSVVRVSSNPRLRAARFPSPQKLLASNGAGSEDGLNLSALTADAHEKSLLLKALGVNVNFAPVADVATDPNAFIYERTFGRDAPTTARCVLAVVEQMRLDGMGSVLKHFPGYGNNADTHTGAAVDERPAETFTAQAELEPFLAHQAGGGATAVLMSHNIIAGVDSALPASLSPAVHALLRRELDFNGVVLTDDLAMEAVSAYAADGAAAVMALQAGSDMVVTADYHTQIPKVLEAVESGALSEARIDEACRRVLAWKQALDLI